MKHILAITLFVLMGNILSAQYFSSPPTIDATVDADYANGPAGWNIGWDETYLYICKLGGAVNEPAIVIFDFDNSLPVSSGTDADGSLVGTNDFGAQYILPFRGDARLYWEADYAEIRLDDGLGGWSAEVTISTADRTNSTTNSEREIRLSWTSLGLAGRPNEFNYFAYNLASGGLVYSLFPNDNPDGYIGTSSKAYFYQTVSNTSSGGSVNPFANNQKSFETRGDFFYGAFQPNTLYDMTIYRTASPEESIRMSADLTIRNNLIIDGVNALFEAATFSGTSTVTFAGDDGTIRVGNGSAMLGESSGNLIHLEFDGYTTLEQLGPNSIDCRQFTINENKTLDANTAALNSNTTGTLGVANINGTIITTNLNGFSGTTTSTVRNSIGTVNMGANSTVIYAATAGTQTVTSRSDYANVTITGGSEKSMASTGDIELSGILSLDDGLLSTGANRVIVANNDEAAITDQSVNSYVNGNLRRAVSTPGNYEFPVGTASQYELAALNFNSGTGFTDIDASFNNTSLSAPIGLESEGSFVDGITTPVLEFLNYGYWNLAAVGSPSGIDYNLTLTSRGHTNAADRVEKHGIFQNIGTSSGSWTEPGVQFDSDTTVDVVVAFATDPISIRIDGVNVFENFAIGFNSGYVLPITLTEFTAIASGANQATLDWKTESEINNSHFDIEHSTDGKEWMPIGKVDGNGTTTLEHDYSFVHNNAISGINYYRLKQVDFDGIAEWSEIRAVQIASANVAFWPNPASDVLYIAASEGIAELYAVSGKLVYSVQLPSSGIDISGLSKGTYLLRITNNEAVQTEKMVIE